MERPVGTEDPVPDQGQGKFTDELDVVRTQLLAGPFNQGLGIVIEEVDIQLVAEGGIVVSQDEGVDRVPEFPDNLRRIGAVANDVTQADDPVDIVGTDVFVNFLPSLKISMNIRNKGISHGNRRVENLLI